MSPLRGRCNDCGAGIWDARSRRCQRCQRAHAALYGRDPDLELTGGHWVPRDGIMRWLPDLTTTTTTRQEA